MKHTLPLAAVLLLASLSPHGAAQRDLEQSGFSDAELERIHDGFEARRDAAFKALSGKPFVAAEKQPSLAPGRPPYVRAYTYSVTGFAMRAMWLNEQLEAANAAVSEMGRYFIGNPDARDDYDNFYWCADVLCRVVEFFGRAGSRAPGRLHPAVEDTVLEMMWLWAKDNSLVSDAEHEQSRTWMLVGSENHHLQKFCTCWQFARFLKNEPRYRDRPFDDGKTAAEHHAAWTAYAKEYFRQRAKKGFLVEFGNSNYGLVGMKGVYNLFDFAEDPVLKKRAGCMLDLFWATWAQEQIGGVRGGGRTRIYQGLNSTRAWLDELGRLAWYYLEVGKASPPRDNDFTILTSAYRMPRVVMDIALDVTGRGVYEVRQWPLGRATEGEERNAMRYHVRTDAGGICRYSFCTPEFILGTALFEARPVEDWTPISAQNRWQGAIFAGDPDARIFPQCRAMARNRCYNAHWSVQSKGTLITQKLKTSKGAAEMRVWFSKPGLEHRIEKEGWVFAQAPGAYAAVRPVAGGYEWQDDEKDKGGQWLACKDHYTPVILEVARKSNFRDYAAFQAAALAKPPQFDRQTLSYRSLDGDALTFYADYSQPPQINGRAVSYAIPDNAFDSPFVRGGWDGGVVTIQKAGRRIVLDFNSQP